MLSKSIGNGQCLFSACTVNKTKVGCVEKWTREIFDVGPTVPQKKLLLVVLHTEMGQQLRYWTTLIVKACSAAKLTHIGKLLQSINCLDKFTYFVSPTHLSDVKLTRQRRKRMFDICSTH
jgi:hypothetical protein